MSTLIKFHAKTADLRNNYFAKSRDLTLPSVNHQDILKVNHLRRTIMWRHRIIEYLDFAQLCSAVLPGHCLHDLANKEPGKMSHARWLTTANRVLKL